MRRLALPLSGAGASTQALTPSLFTNTQTFFAPTVRATYALLAPLMTNVSTFYSATVSAAATGDWIVRARRRGRR